MLYNRDLSWLTFNDRVLQEAADKDVPLYERLKFLAIFSSNLDEFFRVRYPSVVALSHLNKKLRREAVLLNEKDITENIQEYTNRQLEQFGNILCNELIPGLRQHHIHFYYNELLAPQHELEIREIFFSKVLSFIQPVFLSSDTKNVFRPENNQLYFLVSLQYGEGDLAQHVIVNIPSKKLDRFFVLSELNNEKQIVFLDDIIRQNISRIFPGNVLLSVYSVKFNRDAALELNDDYADNLLDKIEKKLSSRDMGAPSRFLYQQGMPAALQMFLADRFNISHSDMVEGGRYHNLSDLMKFPSFDASLSYPKDKPLLYPPGASDGDLFNLIANNDILLHLPYHSYSPVLSFFNQAAIDINVVEIAVTLYRVASESHIVNALISAAKNGKKVTAFIELKARFDEANNIKWSRVMKSAGVKLIYSDPSIKVHSKIALVKTKDGGNDYAIVSTGNFNESTAAFYTDHVLLTSDKKVCGDMEKLFTYLRKKHNEPAQQLGFKNLLVSQFNLLPEFERLIAAEIEKVKNGGKGFIRIKVNNLEEPYFINLLYQASEAGVVVHLIVRSICCLIPQMEGQSMRIVVRRLVDKYLEHTRLFMFGEGNDTQVFMGSSDLMTRNLRRRIEVCVHITDAVAHSSLVNYFEHQWSDNQKMVSLNREMQNVRIEQPGVAPLRSQQSIYELLHKNALHDH